MKTKTSEALPIGLKDIAHLIDPTTWPSDAVCTMSIEVSEDGGKTWRLNSWVKVAKSETNPDQLFGGQLLFSGKSGNPNPEFMIRTSARFEDGTELDMENTLELRDSVALVEDRL